MQAILNVLDSIWNLRLIKGYRTLIARLFTVLLTVYQAIATSQPLIEAGIDLPDINNALLATLIGYFQLKVQQWAKEHKQR